MAIKTYKAMTNGQRGKSTLLNEEITSTTPEKSLLVSLKKKGGRNNKGQITVRHRGGGAKRKYRIIDLLRSGSVSVYDISEDFPNFSHYFKYYDFKMTELNHQAKVFCDLTDRVYEEYSHERKAVANIIKNHRLSAIGFMHLDSGKSGVEILDSLPLQKYCKYIPDYRPERLSELFYQRCD